MDIPLKSLNYLAIDCQATGSSPKSGFPLEIGWLIFKADAFQSKAALTPQTLFIRPPESFELPARITKLTGIDTTHLQGAVSDHNAMEALCNQARMVARHNQIPMCPTVIHFARYEMTFLNELHRRFSISQPLPLDVLCTHYMASRLLPELPRKGLRAVAGYLGHSVPKLKRCGVHLIATAFIWCEMLKMLADHQDIHTLDALRNWYKTSKIPVVEKRFPMPRKIRLGLPEGPGIYRMRRTNEDVLYIGKAGSLKRRVNSYFQSSRNHRENILEMLTQAVKLDYVVTPTALEAALLETDAIKQYKPPYNIALNSEHRDLFYVSRNFDQHSSLRNKSCRLGPVPSLEIFIAAHLIGQCGKRQRDAAMDIPKILAMPKAYCPTQDCFQSGVALFQEKFGEAFRHKAIGQAVLNIGRRSWLEKLKRKTTPESPDEAIESDSEELAKFVWTPDGVAKILESVCRRCGFMIRRSRWFTILSESTVVWKNRNVVTERRNVIQLQWGKVAHRFDSQITKPIPGPRFLRASYSNRQAHLNIETYDRLRVLTTEIRRLLSENRLECIRLNHNVSLYPEQLHILLGWI